ncbi:multidrug efflux MFS transporter [bacterium]|nr:multidrug efflux MFS transporter [bacterium]
MGEQREPLNPYRWLILIGLVTAAILEVLDTTIVNVALATIAGNMGATTEEVAWVSTGYILSNVIVLPMTAWLASVFGRRRYLTGSIVAFIVASFLCGHSTSLWELVFFRILQGAGGAALLSTSQATIREIFPAEQQGTVQSLYVLGVIVAPTVGPYLGGYLTDNYSWPWIFYVNVPIGIVSALIVGTLLGDSKHRMENIKVDFPGILLLALGLGSLQYVLEEGNIKDWFTDPSICVLSLLAGVCLTSLVIWELSPYNRNPVINLWVLKNRELSAALVLFLALGFGLYGGIFIFPLFVQSILGFTPTVTGEALMPGGIATGFTAILCGQLLNRKNPVVKPQALIVIGMALFTYSMWDLAHMTDQSGEPDTRVALILRGAGLGMLFTPINLAAFSSLKGVEIPQGASMLNLMRQLGGSLGIAVLSFFMTRRSAMHYSMLASHAFTGNPAWEQRYNGALQGLQASGLSLPEAQQAAYRMMTGLVKTQAATLSFNDAFLLIGASVVLVSPMVLLLRSGPQGQQSETAQDAH